MKRAPQKGSSRKPTAKMPKRKALTIPILLMQAGFFMDPNSRMSAPPKPGFDFILSQEEGRTESVTEHLWDCPQSVFAALG